MRKRSPKEGAYSRVVIYTGNDCVWCDRAKEYLTRRGVPYDEKNVDENEALFGPDVIQLSGQRHVPVIVVGSRVIVGFRKPELEGELDALLSPHNHDSMGTSADFTIVDPRF